MRRSLAVLVLVLSLPAFAQDDGFKWNPKKKRAPAVGDRYFQVNEDIQQIKSKIAHGKDAKDEAEQTSASTIKYRIVHETLAVENEKVTKERITVERWSIQEDENTQEDKSLTGKSVLIEGTGDKKKVTFEGGSDGVSRRARGWVESTFGAADPMDEIEKLLPKEPIGNDSEWTLDPKEIAENNFKGSDIDEKKSSAKGTLKNVKVEDGVHQGDVEIRISLQLKRVPNTREPIEWKEGGLVDLVVTIQGSLEQEKNRKRTIRMELKLKGRAEHVDKDGPVSAKMDMKMTTSFTSGEMPKK